MARLFALLIFASILATAALAQARKLMPGDRVQIVCEEDPGLCIVRTVGIDGAVAIPGLGAVGIASKTPVAAAARIAELLIDSGELERATVHVTTLFTKELPIEITGAVGRSLTLRFDLEVRLADLLKSAEPVLGADLGKVLVSRANGSSVIVDSESHEFRLAAGDRVYVPMGAGGVAVNVLGGVLNPSAVSYRRGLTLGEAVKMAGGLAGNADPKQIVLERHGEPLPLTLPEDSGFTLLAGDNVRITIRASQGSVAVRGNVVHPGLVDYASGMTVTQAIRAAGGLRPGYPSDDVLIRTVIGKQKRTVRVSLAFINNMRIPDPALAPDDIVEVVGGIKH